MEAPMPCLVEPDRRVGATVCQRRVRRPPAQGGHHPPPWPPHPAHPGLEGSPLPEPLPPLERSGRPPKPTLSIGVPTSSSVASGIRPSARCWATTRSSVLKRSSHRRSVKAVGSMRASLARKKLETSPLVHRSQRRAREPAPKATWFARCQVLSIEKTASVERPFRCRAACGTGAA